MDFEKLFIGAFGAAIGVIGWLFGRGIARMLHL